MSPALRRANPGEAQAIADLQAAAYAENAVIIGRTPIPLTWDYDQVLRDWEVHVLEDAEGLTGVLILQPHDDHLYLESIAVAPRARSLGLGGVMMDATEARARAEGTPVIRLLTNEKSVARIAWYQRRGFTLEFTEELPGRRIVHMIRQLDQC